ncbi:MAG: S4 domain-containing protein, partial [Rhodospirillales bacterium]|nr:S4 domain-containing protein [Rhodospirillales bacterium]
MRSNPTPEKVRPDDDGIRLDRWLREQLPQLPYGLIQRLIRTGQIRVDGHRARAHLRLAAGQMVRIPPVHGQVRKGPAQASAGPHVASLADRILYKDDHFIAFDKPAGLAVQ